MSDYLNENHILVSGFAQTPKGIPANETYKYVGVILLIDKSNHEIVEVDFSIIFSNLTKRVLCELIEGHCVKAPFHDLSAQLKRKVSIPSIGAIIQALRSAFERYNEHIKYYQTV
ncbi:hypothetical protein GCM10008967_16140 [Bacillus carboniphilus]|uniref:DUF3870 domain-containing protein n=1 Tax=Bacillus carboniphilus TaxID=86663 RepID=A0ABN0W626_9BACI